MAIEEKAYCSPEQLMRRVITKLSDIPQLNTILSQIMAQINDEDH